MTNEWYNKKPFAKAIEHTNMDGKFIRYTFEYDIDAIIAEVQRMEREANKPTFTGLRQTITLRYDD